MVLRAIEEIFSGPTKFNLLEIEDFPYDDYEEQWSEYTEAERWFTGAALEDSATIKTSDADLYPMRINPIVSIVLKHAYMLFGEVEDFSRPLVIPKLIYNPKKEEQKQLAIEGEEALNTLWWENRGRAILIENAFSSQIYGGCVFKATYVPWEWDKYGGERSIPIRIEKINPKNFVGVPDASDAYKLIEAWIVREIDAEDAKLWGYVGDEDSVWYVEHWLTNTIEVTINGKPATRLVGTEVIELSGENPFGFIPIVYIPHLRISGLRGFNAYSHLVGMVKELNARWGDLGDSVNDDSHPLIAGRNVPGAVQMKRVTDWLEYADLGSNSNITGDEPEPDMFQVNQQRSSPTMISMVDGIYRQLRRDSFVPAVADGEDEGSQRSGMTLAIRFWPLLSHAGTERYFWSPALDVFHRMLLRMMLVKGLGEITDAHCKLRIKEMWAPFLPRDREVDVNEWAIRATHDIASVEHLIELAGDVEDVTEERARILKWIADLEAARLKATQEFQMQQEEMRAKNQMELAEKNAEAGIQNTMIAGQNQAQIAQMKAKQAPAGAPPVGQKKAAPKPGEKK